MFPWLTKDNNFDTMNKKIQELYALLAIAGSNQIVYVEFDDNTKKEKLRVAINGRMWLNTDNPMSELREFHNILAMNIQEHRTITMYLE